MHTAAHGAAARYGPPTEYNQLESSQNQTLRPWHSPLGTVFPHATESAIHPKAAEVNTTQTPIARSDILTRCQRTHSDTSSRSRKSDAAVAARGSCRSFPERRTYVSSTTIGKLTNSLIKIQTFIPLARRSKGDAGLLGKARYRPPGRSVGNHADSFPKEAEQFGHPVGRVRSSSLLQLGQ